MRCTDRHEIVTIDTVDTFYLRVDGVTSSPGRDRALGGRGRRMGADRDGCVHSRFGRGGFLLVFLCSAAVLLPATRGAIEQVVSGGAPRLGTIFDWRVVVPVLAWAATAPFVLYAAHAVRRITHGSLGRMVVAHVGIAAGWIVLSSLLMRVPGALRGEPVAALLGEAMQGVVKYGPGAVAAYLALIAIGLPRRARTVADSATTPSNEPASARRSPDAPNHLAIRNGIRIHMVSRADVAWVEADGDHVRIHTSEKTYRTRATLGAYERELEADGFLRIHRSALVHPRAICEIQKLYRGDHVAVLREGTEIRIPRTRDDVINSLLPSVGKD